MCPLVVRRKPAFVAIADGLSRLYWSFRGPRLNSGPPCAEPGELRAGAELGVAFTVALPAAASDGIELTDVPFRAEVELTGHAPGKMGVLPMTPTKLTPNSSLGSAARDRAACGPVLRAESA